MALLDRINKETLNKGFAVRDINDNKYYPYKNGCRACGDMFFASTVLFYNSEKVCPRCRGLAKTNAGIILVKAVYESTCTTLWLKMRFNVFKRDNFHCVYCGRGVEDGIKLNCDHVVPLSKGGTTTYGNLVTSCFECNQGKKCAVLSERAKYKKHLT